MPMLKKKKERNRSIDGRRKADKILRRAKRK